jgi:oligosaccharyltransferase complex subunit alpha (ribophorin I)
MVGVVLAIDYTNFINLEVNREIDLTGSYPIITNRIKLENNETHPKAYYHTVAKDDHQNLAHTRAYFKADPLSFLGIEVHEKTSDIVVFKILFPSEFTLNPSSVLVIEEILANKLIPVPKTIGIFDQQLVQFKENIYFYSPYATKRLTTFVKFPSSEIESYTRPVEIDHDLKGKQLVYKPYDQVAAFSVSPLLVHYQNSRPISYFTKVEREIEVSHWGNIAVNEWYTLVNKGAELKGDYSRVDLGNRFRPSAMNALRGLTATLPKDAWGLFYRDFVGNVSTSNARKQATNVNLEIRPRFYILGGWKDTFNLGYNVPTGSFIKQKGNQFILNIAFGLPFKDIIAEETTVKIILPEGSSQITWNLPFNVDKSYYTKTYAFLDFSGKPTLVLEKAYTLDYHRKNIEIFYTLESTSILYKPLILSGYVFTGLVLMILSFRLDLNLEKNTKSKTE